MPQDRTEDRRSRRKVLDGLAGEGIRLADTALGSADDPEALRYAEIAQACLLAAMVGMAQDQDRREQRDAATEGLCYDCAEEVVQHPCRSCGQPTARGATA